jgi:hypothetical protein
LLLGEADLLPLQGGLQEGGDDDELVAVPLGGLAELDVERLYGPGGSPCLLTPPGTGAQSTACRRHTTWLRTRLRSRCRLTQIFSTAWSSARTSGAGYR